METHNDPPYLTKKQLEKELTKENGWGTWTGAGDWEKTKPNLWISKRIKSGENKLWHVVYNFDTKNLKIQKDKDFVFDGTCNDILEFRQICKFVGITI